MERFYHDIAVHHATMSSRRGERSDEPRERADARGTTGLAAWCRNALAGSWLEQAWGTNDDHPWTDADDEAAGSRC